MKKCSVPWCQEEAVGSHTLCVEHWYQNQTERKQISDENLSHFGKLPEWRQPMNAEALEIWYEMANKTLRQFLPPDFPTIVCLCGSTKFLAAYEKANRDETLVRKIVLSIGFCLPHERGRDKASKDNLKQDLDTLHKRKIDLADEILVLNVGGYIGESTRSDIKYATKRGKTIRYLERE